MDQELKEQLVEVIEKLLGDKTTVSSNSYTKGEGVEVDIVLCWLLFVSLII